MSGYCYRVYDKKQRLIYVGSTTNLFPRLKSHEYGSWWACQAVKVRASVFPDIATAQAAERAAILSERPRWNVRGNFPGPGSTIDQIEDFITTIRNGPNPERASIQRHVDGLRRRIAFISGERKSA